MTMPTTLCVLADDFSVGGPAQQLADRWLIGYPSAGAFQRPDCTLQIFCSADSAAEALARRAADHGLKRMPSAAEALAGADAVLIVPANCAEPANDLLDEAIATAKPAARLFVYGMLGTDAASAQQRVQSARKRKLSLLAGGYPSVTFRLPQVDLEAGDAIAEALIVTVGRPGEAEFVGLDGLLPIIERRTGGEAGVRAVTAMTGPAFAKALDQELWPAELLAAALSRTDTPQGDPQRDGRTQDLFGLGLVPKLAVEPVGYLIEHKDGLRTSVLVLNGVIADVNFALRRADGPIVSAQLYRPPVPYGDEYRPLVGLMADYFAAGPSAWPLARSVLSAGLFAAFAAARRTPGRSVSTPELAIAYARR